MTIVGGTHVPFSPSFDYLSTTWLGFMLKLGMPIELAMSTAGFYPRGGGEIVAEIPSTHQLRPLSLGQPIELDTVGGRAVSSQLPAEIAERMAREAKKGLKREGLQTTLETVQWNYGAGAFLSLVFRQAPVPTLFCAIGERGVSSENVAKAAVEQAIQFRNSRCAVDSHAADQLLLPLAFADGQSRFRTAEISRHLLTNAEVIRQFVAREITITGEEGQTGLVEIH